MTEEGSFILNGCEKIVVSQIIRSPGVYFEKKFDTRNKAIYTATIISNKGLWTRVIYDEYPYVYQVKIGERLVEVKVDTGNKKKEKKWEVEPIMRSKVDYYERIYIRFNDYNKMESLEYDVEKEEETDKDYLYLFYLINCFGFTYRDMFDNLKYPLIFFKHLFDRIHKEITETDQFEFHEKNEYKLFNLQSGCLSIGEIGRYKINKQLGLNLPKEVTYLTAHDFIEIINALIELKYYDRRSDDIDHIKNKQVRSIGELLQNQIRMAFLKINRNFNDPAKNSQLLESSFEFDTSEIKDENYIHKNELIIDSRVVTNTIKEFFMTSELSQFMDQINPLAELTHKRRISVFGPNGMKRDHISNVIRDIHPSQYGRLCPVETPEGQNAGLINSIAMYGRVSELGWIESPYFLIKENCVLSNKTPIFLNPEQESHTKIAFCDTSITPFRELTNEYLSAKEDYIFSLEKSKNVLFFTTSPLQLISLATSLIPFIEHDDANRALMGSNMQRQAVPLFLSQKPIVGTGLEFVVPLDSQMVIKSYNEGKVAYSSSSIIKIIDTNNQSISYYLRKYKSSNQDTCINQRPVVWTGEKIFSGQIIADGASTNDGELALGKNLTIAYMPWEGYNYEDAIIISERLLIDDCLTSIHIEEYETTINHSVDPEESERLTKDLPHLTRYVRRHLSKKGIVQIGSYVKEYDVLVGKLVPTELIISPEYALYLAIKGQDAKKQRPSRDVSLRVPEGNQGRVIDIRILSTYVADPVEEYFSTYSEVIKISVAQIRKIQIGDKLAGRHGNKGIISRILSRQDMPYLPDGTPIDIIFNPLGVPSRMNVGQVFEGLLGLAGEYLGKRYKVSAFDEIYGKEASRILVNQKLKEASIKKELNWLFNPLFPGKILLRDGRTGEYFDNPITVGKSYILKLIHLVEDKIHARSTGPYSMITEQPLGGKALNGGQRFGEMEVWALEAHGCSHILQELLMVKSDDIDARNDIYQAIVTRRYDYIIGNPRPTISEAFLVLIRELNALGLDFALQQISYYPEPQTVERDLFKDMEQRIKLREMLNRTKVDKLIALDKISAKENEAFSKILEAEYDKIFKNVKNILKENRKHFKDRIKE
jgi:DNA-directed RNA polymerase subunit beta